MQIIKRSNILEICTDASMKDLTGVYNKQIRSFGCAGAVCINTDEVNINICPDSTNNRAELIAIYLGVVLAEKEYLKYPNKYDEVRVYSDSQFSIFGLTKWIKSWMNNEHNGIMYNTSGKPVANQELFKMIITYCVTHKFKVHFKHQKGHVNLHDYTSLNQASDVYYKSNKEMISCDDIYKISYYNDYIDNETRNKLELVNPDLYPILTTCANTRRVMCRYTVSNNYKEYIMN